MDKEELVELVPRKKVWLEYNKMPIIGKGRYNLLKEIRKTNSLKQSVENLGFCEKTGYNYIKTIEKRLDKKIIISQRGGRSGGGHTTLTPFGEILITKFEELQ